MVSIFKYQDYKVFIKDWISSQERSHGMYRKISESLNMHTTLVSRIVKGDQHFSFEQALDLSEFLNLNDLEQDYLLCMIEYARAGSFKLQELKKSQLRKLRKLSLQTEKKLKDKTLQMDEDDLNIFYSHWHYSAIRLLTSIERFQTKASIVNKLYLSEERFDVVMDFLLEKSLVVKNKNKYEIGPQHTHLSKFSQMIPQIHTNWRLRAIDNFTKIHEGEFSYSCPVTTDKKTIEKK